jgi:hypothetical protein
MENNHKNVNISQSCQNAISTQMETIVELNKGIKIVLYLCVKIIGI